MERELSRRGSVLMEREVTGSGAIIRIWAICKKQNKDTLKNKAVFLQFIIYPVMAFVMEHSVEVEGMVPNFFTFLFAIMFLGMAPLTAMAALLSEEKEKNTLRMLKMAGVTSGEYMLGAGGYLFGICLLGALVFGLIGRLRGREFFTFLAIMAIGIFISLLIGAVIGTWSKNQMAATSISVPVMMIFAFLPMISMFNEEVKQVARFTYTQQIYQLLFDIRKLDISGETVAVILGNLVAAGILFVIAYRKRGF